MVKTEQARYEIMTSIDGNALLKHIELAARTCYKSEPAIRDGSAEHLLRKLVHSLGHESVIEHANVSIRFISNRGFTHELVRHRLASYSQESTRYCNYLKAKFERQITVILPPWFKAINAKRKAGLDNLSKTDLTQLDLYYVWNNAMCEAENHYFELIDAGLRPEQARGVLPIDLKTEVVMTANLREWRHILKLRTSPQAHPQMKELMIPLLKHFQAQVPVIFDDIKPC